MKRKTTAVITALAMLVTMLFSGTSVVLADSCYHEPGPERKTEKTGDDVTDVDTYAKCTKCGEWYLYCTNTPNSLSQATRHNWIQGDVGKATCTDDGFYEVKCTVCDTVVKEITQEALGHEWSDWTVTKAATGSVEGEETRTCSVCGATEKRAIEPDGTIDMISGGIDVYILEMLLAYGGEYTGDIDGYFDSSVEAAVREFEANSGLAVTGKVFPATMQLIAGRYAADMVPELICEEVYESLACGLKVAGLVDMYYTSNGDGTHQTEGKLVGLYFTRGGESRKILIPEGTGPVMEPVTDECLVHNGELTCSECGYQADPLAMAFVGMEEYNSRSDRKLSVLTPFVEGEQIKDIRIEDKILFWSPFPGAEKYHVELHTLTPDIIEGDYNIILERIDQDDLTGTEWDLSEKLEDNVRYIIFITAVDGEGKDISAEREVYYLNATLPPNVVQASFDKENNVITWYSDSYQTESESYSIFVECGDGETYNLCGGYLDEKYLTEDNVFGCYYLRQEQIDALQGKVFRFKIELYTEGCSGPGNPGYTPYTTYEEMVCKVVSAANLREGPGKEYERIGEVATGNFVNPIKQQDGYTYIEYNGNFGWIINGALLYAPPQIHTVTMVVSTLKETFTVDRPTRPDGTLDFFALPEWTIKGTEIAGWTLKEHKAFQYVSPESELLPNNYVFEKDTTIYAEWRSSAKYTLNFYGLDGKEMPELSRSENINDPVTELPLLNDKPVMWCISGDRKQEVKKGVYLKNQTYDLYALEMTELVTTRSVNMYEHSSTNSNFLVNIPKDETVYIRGRRGSYYYCEYGGFKGYVPRSGFEDIRVIVTFDAGKGYCPIESLETRTVLEQKDGDMYYGMLRTSDFPISSRDGYLFIGWEDDNGYPVDSSYEFYKSETLHAVYAKCDIKGGRQGVVAGDDHFKHEYYFFFEYPEDESSTPCVEKFVGEMVTILGERGDYYYVYDTIYGDNPDNEKNFGYMRKDRVRTDFYTVELPPGDIRVYKWEGMDTPFPYYEVVLWSYDLTVPGSREFTCIGETEDAYYIIVRYEQFSYYANPTVFDYADDFEWDMSYGYVWKYQAKRSEITVTFDANGGGTVSGPQIMKVNGSGNLDSLPEVDEKSKGRAFLGWYTDPVLGELVTTKTLFDCNTTVYAHYDDLIYVVCGDGARLYPTPTIKTFTFEGEYIPPGSVGVCTMVKNGFAHVTINGKTGWLKESSIEEGTIGYVRTILSKTDTAVRKSPKMSSKKVGDIDKKTCYVICSKENGYYKVAGEPWGRDFVYISKDHQWKLFN